MSEECDVDFDLRVENVQEVLRILDGFPEYVHDELYTSMERIASEKERELKQMAGWTDRTGHFRRSLYVAPTFDPIGIEFGSFAAYGFWVANPHGTWSPTWWEEWIEICVRQMEDRLLGALDKIIKKFNTEYGT
jgi:hypothetical protein